MKHVRFFLEYETPALRRKKQHSGNVFAAFVGNGRSRSGGWDGIGAVFNYPNSPVASTSTSRESQNSGCYKRISEAEARKIHPNLFAVLS